MRPQQEDPSADGLFWWHPLFSSRPGRNRLSDVGSPAGTPLLGETGDSAFRCERHENRLRALGQEHRRRNGLFSWHPPVLVATTGAAVPPARRIGVRSFPPLGPHQADARSTISVGRIVACTAGRPASMSSRTDAMCRPCVSDG